MEENGEKQDCSEGAIRSDKVCHSPMRRYRTKTVLPGALTLGPQSNLIIGCGHPHNTVMSDVPERINS